MPRIGVPNLYIALGALNVFLKLTELGPPLSIIPLGFIFFISPESVLYGFTILYIPSSLTLRAISCVYWEPKSKIRIEFFFLAHYLG